MILVDEIKGLLTEQYEPGKKALYVELHNRVFLLDKLDIECKYCGAKAFYKLTEFLKNNQMATETKKTSSGYEVVNPDKIATVKIATGQSLRYVQLSKDTDQATLEAAYKAGHTSYVKKVGE